jgi:hypothetical protein
VRFDNNKYSVVASAVGRPVEVHAFRPFYRGQSREFDSAMKRRPVTPPASSETSQSSDGIMRQLDAQPRLAPTTLPVPARSSRHSAFQRLGYNR